MKIWYHSEKTIGSHPYLGREDSDHCLVCGMSRQEATEGGFTDRQVQDPEKL